MRTRAAVLLAALLVAGTARAAVDPSAPTVMIRALVGGKVASLGAPPRVKLGAPFHVIVTAVPGPGVAVIWPTGFPAGDFEVVERRDARLDGEPGVACDLTVVAWALGSRVFPPVPVTYVVAGEARRINSDGLAVEVVATVVDPAHAAPKPSAGPIRVLVRDLTLVLAAAAALGAALLVIGAVVLVGRLRRRRARRRVAAAIDRRTPEAIALDRLRALAAASDLGAPDQRPLYFGASEIVKEYLGRRFGFAALELTTSELLAALARSCGDESVRAAVAGWLGASDPVKYAGARAGRDEAAAALAAAAALVERARPAPVPAGEAVARA